jgi:hypothetical protein
MGMIDSLLAEFEHEARTTRRHLESLPGEKLDLRPHQSLKFAGHWIRKRKHRKFRKTAVDADGDAGLSILRSSIRR